MSKFAQDIDALKTLTDISFSESTGKEYTQGSYNPDPTTAQLKAGAIYFHGALTDGQNRRLWDLQQKGLIQVNPGSFHSHQPVIQVIVREGKNAALTELAAQEAGRRQEGRALAAALTDFLGIEWTWDGLRAKTEQPLELVTAGTAPSAAKAAAAELSAKTKALVEGGAIVLNAQFLNHGDAKYGSVSDSDLCKFAKVREAYELAKPALTTDGRGTLEGKVQTQMPIDKGQFNYIG